MNETETQELEVMPMSALHALEKAQIDMQIATAKQYPRSVKKFLQTAEAMVTANIDTAESCFYCLKRKDKQGREVFIEGPSVRLLEIAASAWGNLRYGARVIDETDKFIVAQGVGFDLENNVSQTLEVRRRITTTNGKRYGDDMIGVTANAACSIAKRNALNGVVPRVYVNQLEEKAKQCARGNAQAVEQRRNKAIDFFVQKYGVAKERVLAFLGKDELSMTVEDLDRLTGLKTALKDGETTLEEAFNPTVDAPRKDAAKFADDSNPDLQPGKPSSTPATSVATTSQSGISASPAGNSSAPNVTPEAKPADATKKTPQQDLAEFMGAAGVSFDDLRGFLSSPNYAHDLHKMVADWQSVGGYDELPVQLCEALAKDVKAMAKITKTWGKGAK